jgi:CRISPR-associated protein Cas1
MDERIIDLSEQPAGLSIQLDQLVVRLDSDAVTVPLEDLAALVVSHPAVHYTQAVLSEICARGGSVVICDLKRMPIGMLMPLAGHSTQAERFAVQAAAGKPLRKQVWQQIVRCKVRAQAAVLEQRCGSDLGLRALAARVKSGDTGNIEAQASRRYWPALFGGDFRRVPRAEDNVNGLLNYGYAVVRALTARAICASGLHPSIGVHHHNRYNPFCLADDLMEPFRPTVDRAVMSILEDDSIGPGVHKQSKATLITTAVDSTFCLKKEQRRMFDTLAKTTASLASIYEGKRKRLLLPDF